jgi:hypothetical protein
MTVVRPVASIPLLAVAARQLDGGFDASVHIEPVAGP